MHRGVDYSWDRPALQDLIAAGYTFVVRYISNDHRIIGGREKNLDAAEATALTDAGLNIVLVWEGVAVDRDPLKGYQQGVADAKSADAQAKMVGAPTGCVIYFAVDWNASLIELISVSEYFRGVASVLGVDRVGGYGGFHVVQYLFDSGKISYGWQTYAWSTFSDGGLTPEPYLHWDERAQLRQVLNNQRIGAAAVDLDEAYTDSFGQWRVTMTYAPQDLINVRAYVQAKTGLDIVSLGITGDAAHAATGGYHIGRDDLVAAGRLDYDYSVVESARDANPTNAASAFDLANFSVPGPGGVTLDRHAVTRAVLDALNAGDPRTADIREMIYSLDDVNVARWDRLGIRTTGDSSHTFHTHWSFFRDSEGRRDGDANFLGLLKEIFDGVPYEEDDMFALVLPIPHKVPVYGKDANGNEVIVDYRWHDDWPGGDASYTVPTVNSGIVPWGAAWLSFCNDTFGDKYAVRVAGGNGGAKIYANPAVLSNLQRWYVPLDNNTAFISLRRVPVDANDTMTVPVSACIEYARRT